MRDVLARRRDRVESRVVGQVGWMPKRILRVGEVAFAIVVAILLHLDPAPFRGLYTVATHWAVTSVGLLAEESHAGPNVVSVVRVNRLLPTEDQIHGLAATTLNWTEDLRR